MNEPNTNTPAPGASAAATPPGNTNGARKRGFLVLAVLVLASAMAWGAHWLLVSRYFQSTDDAYVSSDLVQITSQVPGTVIAVRADDTQSVARGQVLAELDPADAQVALSGSEAQLARAVRTVRALFAQRDELRAQIAQRESDLSRVQNDLQRRASLQADGAVSGEELSHARDAVALARAALDAARGQLNATEAQIQGTTIATHPQVLDAEATVRNADLALRRTELRSPVTGVVAKRSVELGQRIAAGTPLMAVVPLDDVWVDANFKEGQLRNMRVGQPVTLQADVYGGNVVFHGHLAGLAAGSGTAFALLPAQNASGNWIKIVQRLPVRVALDPRELAAHPLRVGLSMTAQVDVRDTSGPLVATQVRGVPQPEQDSVGEDPLLEARIRSIVAQNSGDSAHSALAQAAIP
jgi:membrane fusion protein, multidrug efflux system